MNNDRLHLRAVHEVTLLSPSTELSCYTGLSEVLIVQSVGWWSVVVTTVLTPQ